MKILDKFRNRKGFTLIELIVVMAILAILVALGAPRFLGYTKDANVTAMRADTKIIEQAAYQYAIQNDDKWPVTDFVDLDGNDVADDSFEVGIDYSPDVMFIMAEALKAKGLSDSTTPSLMDATTTLINAGNIRPIDANKIAPYIRSTKNPLGKYFIIDHAEMTQYNNELEGMVFYLEAIPSSDGKLNSGLYSIKK